VEEQRERNEDGVALKEQGRIGKRNGETRTNEH